ncbi:prolyl oligopeptidase family serine peptidase [Sphingomonas sp. ASV193]|uniref:prolyl oligopeptidase family serine peptidase n=1 Tax=Sphingomonas sp. ASV193 TaxID=3144405 RepID=UPI0032E910FB
MRPTVAVLLACAIAMPTSLSAQPIAYPPARTVTQVDDYSGTKVADPYRWLENDVRNDKEVEAWVAAQGALTQSVLAKMPLRDWFKAEMTRLFDYERYNLPVKRGAAYFYRHNTGLQNQSLLFVRDGLDGKPRLLIDPNGWSKDGATALAEWTPSEDGRLLAYSIQDGGTDWRTVRLIDVASGKPLPDELKWLKYSGDVAWAKDGSGFYYSRYPAPAAGETFQQSTLNQKIYFHRLGTAQEADRVVYATPAQPKLNHGAIVTDDGRYLVVVSSDAGDENDVHVIDLAKPAAKPVALFTGLKHQWQFLGNEGTRFYFVTDKDAPNRKIATADLARPTAPARTLIPAGPMSIDSASLVGGRLVLGYLKDASSEAQIYTLGGKRQSVVALPGLGTVSGFGGKADDPETFFAFTSYNQPGAIYRLDVHTGQESVWARTKTTFDPDSISVAETFYKSKDGTRIPLWIVKRKDVTGPAPTMLYGYGGFDISLTPSFNPANLAWVERGGVFALANLRGGGEYGTAWHDAGKLAKKQNVFDDFIAAGEYLKASGISTPHGLSAIGRSNGGLLIGATTNQRPDLFDAVSPGVGVMDMLRFDQFTAGRFWVGDYGYPEKPADFKTLYAYSPYHNIRGGRAYPPLIAVTADTDDRVVPGHTFKYMARLQHTPGVGEEPHIVRIETRAGHGSGKPISKTIDEYADVYAFLAYYTGLK